MKVGYIRVSTIEQNEARQEVLMEQLGGKWNRKAGGHVFDYDPSEKIEDILLTGEYTDAKKDYQFFPTPPDLAEYLCDLAEIDETTTVLEKILQEHLLLT